MNWEIMDSYETVLIMGNHLKNPDSYETVWKKEKYLEKSG